MKVATLALIVQDGKVLLGYKKKGEIGSKTLNGPGGKCEEGGSPLDCVVRETQEELHIGLNRDSLNEVAIITFFAAGVADFKVHVFRCESFDGKPEETADMIPSWHDLDHLPLEQMLESDREWFLKAAMGEKFQARVYYKQRAAEFEKIEFDPYRSA